MIILGISGLEQAMPFKRRHWPQLDEREYRISQGHDAAAALIRSGEIIAAAAEERFDRKKQSSHFPVQAISWCLERAGLHLGDVDALVHGFDYEPYLEIYSLDPVTREFFDTVLSREALEKPMRRDLKDFPSSAFIMSRITWPTPPALIIPRVGTNASWSSSMPWEKRTGRAFLQAGTANFIAWPLSPPRIPSEFFIR